MPGVVREWQGKEPLKLDAPAEQPSIPEEEGQIEEYLVIHQEVTIDVDFHTKSIQGESKISVYCLNTKNPPEDIGLDARQCDIDLSKVTVNGKNVRASYRDPYESLTIPKAWDLTPSNYPVWKNRMKNLMPRRRRDLGTDAREREGCLPADGSLRICLRPDAPNQPQKSSIVKLRAPSSAVDNNTSNADKEGLYEIVIPFHTTNIRDGLHFVGVDDSDTRFPHVYTRHSIEPGTASCIFPCLDDPGARSTWKVRVKCPRTLGDVLRQPLASHQQASNGVVDRPAREKHNMLSEEDKLIEMTVVCTGNLVGEKIDEVDETKKIMTFEIIGHPAAARHVGFAVGPFEHLNLSALRSEAAGDKLGISALRIHGWHLPGRGDEVRHACEEVLTLAADDFVLSYGSYPFEGYKLCFVDDMIAPTVPLLGFTLCSSRMLYPVDSVDPEFEVTRTLVHSLACQYFGLYIVPNQRSETWLTVGIAYYMTDFFLSKLCGKNDYRFRIKNMADRLCDEDHGRPSLHDLGTYLHLGEFEMEFMALKAPLVLFILDKRLTKAAGSAGASLARIISKIITKANTSYGHEAEDQAISSKTMQKICQKISAYDLEPFWAEWVHASGCPSLHFSQKFNKKQLCVDITIQQTQAGQGSKPEPIQKSDFWRELLEDVNHVYAGDVQPLFTGPMTIRVHEANGTPYEHTVDIREDAVIKGAKFLIPYNTKYKRLKRRRRQKERAAAAAAAAAEHENAEEAIVFSLGEKLDSQQDMDLWGLVDWSPEDEQKMEGDSYEWVRIDTDFEWIYRIHSDLKSWMYTSQLQQDRDVVAQQESLLYLAKIRAHAMSATILTRTLYDDRYYYGLRTMAADLLSKQTLPPSAVDATKGVIYRGMSQLMRAFSEYFCYPGTHTPRPNDFSDKRQYAVQCAIVTAVSKVQYDNMHPQEAQRFLLEQLQFNNNSNNPYTDHFYVAKLLDALATSLTSTSRPPAKKTDMSFSFDDADGSDDDLDEDMVDIESHELLQQALAEIERYRRMDEWTGSYQNLWTRTALDCQRKLMKAGVIPVSPLEFVQYLQDGTLDVVQIKAFEALVDLGLMLKVPIMRLLVSTMSTHSSPYMRDQLFKIFCEGLASVAFGEHKELEEVVGPNQDELALIIENDDNVIKQNQTDLARRLDIGSAMAAMKKALKDNADLQVALWDAMNSAVLGSFEKRNLMALFEVLFDGDESLLLTVRHPTKWTVQRQPKGATLTFKAVLRELRPPPPKEPEVVPVAPPPVPAGPVAVLVPPEKKAGPPRIKLQSNRPSLSGPAGPNGTPSTPAPRQGSISVAPPAPVAPVADSIAVQPVQRILLPSETPPPAPLLISSSSDTISATSQSQLAKLANKRKRVDRETESPRPSKVIKLRLSKNYHDKLRDDTRRQIESSGSRNASQQDDSIRAAAPLSAGPRSEPSPQTLRESPSSGIVAVSSQAPASKPARKPLPSGAPISSPTPPAGPAPPAAQNKFKIKLKVPTASSPQ